jgi:hypothetical protein
MSGGEELDEEDLRVRSDIARYGWHVALVPPDRPEDPRSIGWGFTIGLTERFGHPEIALFGMEQRATHQILNRSAVAVRKGWRLEPGDAYAGLLEGYECAVRSIERRWHAIFFGNAQWYYRGDAFSMLQLFWPDEARRFPWQEGFATAWRSDQPLLYLLDEDAALSASLRAALRREGAL